MADDAGQVIGKISIKVWPDTRDFRDRLKKDLRKIEAAEEIKIQAEADTDRLELSTRKAVAAINAKSKSGAAGMTIKIRAELDARDLDDRIRRIVDEANRAKLEIDTDGAVRSLDGVAEAGERSSDRLARAFTHDTKQMIDDVAEAGRRIDAELSAIAREKKAIALRAMVEENSIRRAEQDLEDLIGDYDGKKITLHAALADTAYRYVQAKMAWLSRHRDSMIVPVVNSKAYAAAATALAALSGGRLLSSTLSNITDLFKNLDKNIPLIGSIAMAVMGLSGWLLAAASNTFTLSRGLAQIAGAGLTLPGILGGLAVGLGATIAVLKDFNNEIPELAGSLSSLQDQMSANFWDVARAPMREMIQTIFPEFSAGLNGTATALGHFFANLSTSARKHLSGALVPMFANLQQSIAIAANGTDDFIGIVEALGTTGSKYLPRLAAWVNDLAESFHTWLDDAAADGRLEEWIETGILRMREFGSVVSGASSILAGLARAADQAGGSTLASMADTLERVANVVNGDSFQTQLVQVLKASHDAMSMIAKVSGPQVKEMFSELGSTMSIALRTIAPAIGELVRGISEALSTDGFQEGFISFLDGIRHGVDSLAPVWAPLGDAIGTVGQVAGQLAESFGPLLAELLVQVADLANQAGPALGDMAASISGDLLSALQILGPLLVDLVSGLVNLLGPVLSSTPAVAALAAAFVGFKTALALESIAGGIAIFRAFVQDHGLVTKMAGALQGLAGKLGLIGAGVAGLTMFTQWVGDIGVAAPGINAFSTAIAGLGVGPTAAGFDKLNAMFTGNASGADWLNRDFTGKFKNLATDVHGLGDALQYVNQWAEAGTIDKLLGSNDSTGGLWTHTPAFNQAKEALLEFDTAMAQVVASGNQEQIAQAQQYIASEIGNTDLSYQQAMDLMPSYAQALADQAVSSDLAAASHAQLQQDIAAAEAAYSAAVASMSGVTPSMIEAVNEASKAFIDIPGSISEAEGSLSSWIGSLQEQIAAQQTWATDMATITQALPGIVGESADQVVQSLNSLGTEGAPYVAELAAGIRSGSGDVDSAFQTIADAARLGAEGAKSDASTPFGELAGDVADAMSGVPQTITDGFGNTYEIGSSKGADTGRGFVAGMNSQMGSVQAAANAMADAASVNLSKRLQIHSPSRVMIGLGRWTVLGLVKGLKDNTPKVKSAVTAMANIVKSAFTLDGGLGSQDIRKMTDRLVSSLTGGYEAKLDKRIDQLTEKISKLNDAAPSKATTKWQKIVDDYDKRIAALSLKAAKTSDGDAKKRIQNEIQVLRAEQSIARNKLNDAKKADEAAKKRRKKKLEAEKKALQKELDAVKKHQERIEKVIERVTTKYQKRLDKLESKWDKLSDRIDDATRALEDARQAMNDYIATTSASVTAEGNIVNLFGELGEKGKKAQTVGRLTEALAEVVAQSKAYRKNIVGLAKRGFSEDLIQQMVDAGMGSAADVAEMLANATDAELKELNRLWSELEKQGDGMGKSLGTLYYKAGVDAAKGILQGLKDQKKDLEKQMRDLGKAMVSEIKKELKIKSPSRVLMRVGHWTTQGLANGLRNGYDTVRSAAASMYRAVTDGAERPSTAAFAAQTNGVTAAPQRVLHYHAAEGRSLPEEDLFEAANRSRMVGW